MNYTPQTGDTLHRADSAPITIEKYTDTSVIYERLGVRSTEPRAVFDPLLSRTIEKGEVRIVRKGEQVFPPAGVTGSSNTHARLSPSSSKQWTQCTASIAYIEANSHRVPADTSSVWSQEGTQAHEFAAEVLLGTTKIDDVPHPFREHVKAYVGYCLALVPEGVSYQVEVSADLFYQPESQGTCDFAVVTDDEIHIADLKYGAGVLVEAEANTQLAIYGLSLIRMLGAVYDFTPETKVSLHVFQPRHHEAQNAQPWVLTLGELNEFGEQIKARAMEAHEGVEKVRATLSCGDEDIPPDAITLSAPAVSFHPSDDTCKFCKAKAFCGVRHADTTGDAITSATLALMPDLTKEDRKGDPATVIGAQVVTDVPAHLEHGGTLPLEYLLGVFRNRKKIEKFLGDVGEYLENLAREQPIPGLKWVKGRDGNRSWRNEEEAETFCRGQKLKQEERCTFKLKSPTQIEALLKDKLTNTRTKNRFEELISRSDGRPVLVPEEDKRAALPASGDVMPNLEDDI